MTLYVRDARVTSAPIEAKRMHVCLPNPVFPPVTTTYMYGSGVIHLRILKYIR